MLRASLLLSLLAFSSVACSYASDALFDSSNSTSGGASGIPGQPGPDPTGSSGATGSSGTNGTSSGTTPPPPPAPTCDDGLKNGNEADIDCGVACNVVCAVGSECAVVEDCAERVCLNGRCQPPTGTDQVMNGDETDVDCGGSTTGAARCAVGQRCLARTDCASRGCKDSLCIEAPSCIAHFGGDTCGTGEIYPPNGAPVVHESCCRSLPVNGYVDPGHPNKTVYLDKYEITAGRMRAFLDALSEGGAEPNVKAWISAAMAGAPAGKRWNPGWTEILPTSNGGELFGYAVPNGNQYPDNSVYQATNTQGDWSIVSGNYQINTGIYSVLGGVPLYAEYSPAYAVYHNFNCPNGNGGYGFSTYWMPADIVATYSGGVGKFFDQNVLDQKALNCAPNALFAAFCEWDGGELATTEVVDLVTGSGAAYAAASCGSGINISSDGGSACNTVYNYPYDDGVQQYDGSARVAAPGRVAADVVSYNGETWSDLQGNLVEVTMASDVEMFDKRGLGIGYGSAAHHILQMRLPRGKGATFGARCMRFK